MYEHENKRDIHARSSSAARLATPRLVTTRRAAGCGNEPSRCLNKGHAGAETFSVVDTEFERRASSAAACSLRLPILLHLPSLASRLLLFAYKREVAPLRETHQNYFFLSPPVPEHCAAATIFSIPACGVHRRSGQ